MAAGWRNGIKRIRREKNCQRADDVAEQFARGQRVVEGMKNGEENVERSLS